MSWRDPTPFEQDLLADASGRWPEIIPLARIVTLAPRIEPLLLRNARQQFVPQATAELESQLWFSPLVSARSTREIVLHQGVAKILAGQLPAAGDQANALQNVWTFTQLNTRHWTPEERLERDLRYYALLDHSDRVSDGLKDVLRLIYHEPDEAKRFELSRLAKRSLPVVAPDGHANDEGQLLARYAALALGDSGDWAVSDELAELPAWLADSLPPPIARASLCVTVHYDAKAGQVLHFVEPEEDAQQIEFPTPLPARLHVAEAGQVGKWYSVTFFTSKPRRNNNSRNSSNRIFASDVPRKILEINFSCFPIFTSQEPMDYPFIV